MARFVPGKRRSGVVHCYPLSFAVKANITVIRGNCGRTNREPAKEGRHIGRRHLFAASQTVNFPGTSDCLDITQSEIARQRSTTRPSPSRLAASFLPSFLLSTRCALLLSRHSRFVPLGGGWVKGGNGGTKQIALLRPALSFPRGCDGGGLMTYQTGK